LGVARRAVPVVLGVVPVSGPFPDRARHPVEAVASARKWARLALAGNPTVLLVLFAPDHEVVFRDEAGAELAANAHRFVSRLAASRYLGYLKGQKAAMTGQPGAHTNRPELVAVHGYDTKYAMHALRLARLRDNPAIADQPDRRWVDDWLHRSYLNFWTRNR
jgi:uncharacterized protein